MARKFFREKVSVLEKFTGKGPLNGASMKVLVPVQQITLVKQKEMPRQSVINTRTQYISSFLKRKRFIFQLSTDLTKFQNIFCKLGEC